MGTWVTGLGLVPGLYNLIVTTDSCKDTISKGIRTNMNCGRTLLDHAVTGPCCLSGDMATVRNSVVQEKIEDPAKSEKHRRKTVPTVGTFSLSQVKVTPPLCQLLGGRMWVCHPDIMSSGVQVCLPLASQHLKGGTHAQCQMNTVITERHSTTGRDKGSI